MKEHTIYKIYKSKIVHFKSDYKVSTFPQHSHTSQTILVVTSIIKQTIYTKGAYNDSILQVNLTD